MTAWTLNNLNVWLKSNKILILILNWMFRSDRIVLVFDDCYYCNILIKDFYWPVTTWSSRFMILSKWSQHHYIEIQWIFMIDKRWKTREILYCRLNEIIHGMDGIICSEANKKNNTYLNVKNKKFVESILTFECVCLVRCKIYD